MSTGVELKCSAEEAWQYHLAREARDSDFSSYAIQPDFLDDPVVTHELLQEAERRIIATDYEIGSATCDDELLVIKGLGDVLLTAEHATRHVRTTQDGSKYTKVSDLGTGGLCKVVAVHTQADSIIAIGRQTGDANSDEKHPLKNEMDKVISLPLNRAHISIHGMMRAKATAVEDARGYSVMLGLGDEPSPATKALVDYLLEAAKDYDLRVGVNQAFLKFDTKKRRPLVRSNNTIETNIFKAPYVTGQYTTRGHAQKTAKRLAKDDSYAALQIELSDVLRPRKERSKKFPTQRDQQIGAYLGYLFVRLATESVRRL
jgi:hypothetical protein